MPSSAEVRRHHDADVHPQGDWRLGRASPRASWNRGSRSPHRGPINTEASGSLHIKDKAAANTTVFLACRPRPPAELADKTRYWEDVEPLVAGAVRGRVEEFQRAGIGGVDLFLAAFGPALEEFSRHWPLQRGEPRDRPPLPRGQRTTPLLDEPWDPYAVTPEDALDVARREIKRWRLERLTRLTPNTDLDPTTAFFVLAWDTFRAPIFDYDEALRLARAVGIDLDRELTGRLAGKSGSKLTLWDSTRRAATGVLGPADGSRGMIDALHHAANAVRSKSLAAGAGAARPNQRRPRPALLRRPRGGPRGAAHIARHHRRETQRR